MLWIYELSEFLSRSLTIFIIQGFRTMVFIFMVIFTTFRLICPPGFFRCNGYERWFPKLLKRQSSGGCRINPYLPNPSARAGYDTRLNLSGVWQVSIQSFPSLRRCLTKSEEPSLSYYLPIAGGRIIGFIPFLRVLVLCEMQSVSSRIWTRITVSISYDDRYQDQSLLPTSNNTGILSTYTQLLLTESEQETPRLNKGHGSKFRADSLVR